MSRASVRSQRLPAQMALAALLVLGCKVGTGPTDPSESPRNDAPTDGGSDGSDAADVIAASDLPPTIERPLAGDDMGVTIHRLSNGMTVYLSTDRQKPRFTAWIGVRAGSRHDPADSTGLAHYLEHMLFKGTDDYGTLDAKAEAAHVERVRKLYAELRKTDDPAARKKLFAEIDAETQAQAKTAVPNELSRMYSTMGVEGTNAFTSNEQTVYIGDFPANRLEAWATVEAERFADPVFRLFYPELEAVYEEKNLSMDNPWRRVNEAMMLELFPEHPYGTQPTIGLVEHLKTPAYQDMADYFERWYVPNNMAIVLAGDIDAKTALPILEEKFGRLEPRPLPKPAPGKLPKLSGRKVVEVVADGEESATIAWHTVPVAHADEPVLAVMDRLLDDQRVGLLNVQLELTQKVPSAGSYGDSMREAGYFVVNARARSDQKPEELEPMLLEVIGKLKAGEFTEADVDAVKVQEAVSRKQRLEFPFARASRMMDAFVSHRGWDEIVGRDAAFDAVTRADVMRVAKAYLGDDRLVVYRRKGKPDVAKIEKPEITPVPIDPSRQSEFATNVASMPTKPLQPEWVEEGRHYSHTEIPSGQVIAAKNPRNDLFTLSYTADRGYRKEPLLCYALDLLELSGTKKMSAEELQKKLYALGSRVYTTCNAEEATIEISGVDSKLEDTLKLVDEWLAEPTFDDAALSRHFDNQISRRRDQLEEDGTLTAALDLYAQYGRESAWLQHPANRSLERAKAGQLQRLVSEFFAWEHDVHYFGPRPAADIAKIAARGPGKSYKRTGDVWTRKYRPVKGAKIYFLHKDTAKANVRFVMSQPPLARDDRPRARLFSEYLSGSMSALVFQEIRESRGLAYSAYSRYDWGRKPQDASGLLGYMSTQADKVPVAVETFLGLLRSQEIQPERVLEAKLSLDQEYRSTRIDPRWIVGWVEGWDRLGEKQDPRPWEWTTIQGLEADDVRTFASRFPEDGTVIISIVGDKTRIDLEALRKVAPIEEVQAEDLFSYGKFPPKAPGGAVRDPNAKAKEAIDKTPKGKAKMKERAGAKGAAAQAPKPE
jgi:predicted Zn-dependent peptidase